MANTHLKTENKPFLDYATDGKGNVEVVLHMSLKHFLLLQDITDYGRDTMQNGCTKMIARNIKEYRNDPKLLTLELIQFDEKNLQMMAEILKVIDIVK